MAISNQTIWEVESGGNDTNGGGFVNASSGTDFSQQTTAQISVTDAVAVGSTTITSATANFAATAVGNIIYLAGGTGTLTPDWYQVVTFVSNTTITVDRNVATGTGITLNLGGAFATIQTALNVLTDSQIVYVKAAIYSISSTLVVPGFSASDYYTRIIGYSTVRGDNGRPTISQTAAADGIDLTANDGVAIENFIIGGTGIGLIAGLFTQYAKISNCMIKNWTDFALELASDNLVRSCEITGCTGSRGISCSFNASLNNLYIHDNNFGAGGSAIYGVSQGVVLIASVIANNIGSGMQIGFSNEIFSNLFYNNSIDGIFASFSYSFAINTAVRNNIFALNGGYGINAISNGTPMNTYPWINNNGFWSNGTAAVNNITLSASNILITGTSPTNDPFVNDAGNNFALNNIAGAGALFRAKGFPGTLVGLPTTTGFADIGPFQHGDPVANTGGSFTFVM